MESSKTPTEKPSVLFPDCPCNDICDLGGSWLIVCECIEKSGDACRHSAQSPEVVGQGGTNA